ncbi:YCF48-related protein [Vitiosangium sp. GDMCC 1.1324]|uniref:WD40/YVTN/BNR-like repeat-containing protein n=1 Tax=Vitiosangium sp. (strain GDMCC 1.1324) TaxID=2138576 RepID=UPI00130E5914|nr:YCF48-related protein [Vitiosangium sp. GDMCC 1.1324]
MRNALWAMAALTLVACRSSENPLTVVGLAPSDGSTLQSKCPIKVQFSDTVHDATLNTGGSIAQPGPIPQLWSTTERENDTAEFYPPAGDWKTGTQSFSFTAKELFGSEVAGTASYQVQKTPDESWVRAVGHRRGSFVQGSFSDVWFADALTGYAVEFNGSIFKTVNGGSSWTMVASVPEAIFGAVWGPDASHVFAVNEAGSLYATTDGGATWTEVGQFPPGAVAALPMELTGLDANTLLVASRLNILRSTDGGHHWASVAFESSDQFSALYVRSASEMWAGTLGGAFYRSTDSGATWTKSATAAPSSIFGIATNGAGKLWIAGGASTIATSTDNGDHWTVQMQKAGGEQWAGIFTADGQHLYVAGVVGSVAGSSNGGTSWTVQDKRFSTRFGAMHGTPSGAPWAAGIDGYLVTTANGTDWTDATRGNNRDLHALWVVDADHVIAIGEASTVVNTSDRGATWTRRDLGTAATRLTAVYGVGAQRWVTDELGKIHYSQDHGDTWSERASVNEKLLTLFGLDTNHLWTGGGLCIFAGATVYRSSDGGQNWQPSTIKDLACVTDLWAADANHVFAAGIAPGNGITGKAAVAISTDGGATWRQVQIDDGSLKAIWGADATHLWAVGEAKVLNAAQGMVARSDDGGATWKRQYWAEADTYDDVFAPTVGLAWGAGNWRGAQAVVFSTDNPCGVPGRQAEVARELRHGLHGTPDGKHLWMVGAEGVILTLDRP